MVNFALDPSVTRLNASEVGAIDFSVAIDYVPALVLARYNQSVVWEYPDIILNMPGKWPRDGGKRACLRERAQPQMTTYLLPTEAPRYAVGLVAKQDQPRP